MKKLIIGMFAIVVLFATSCADLEPSIQTGLNSQVTLSVNLEGGISTRAISDGKSADKLIYAVYDANGKLISTIRPVEKDNVSFPTTETITLANGQTYTVVFWAQNSNCNAYTTSIEDDGINVAIDYQGINNDESRDAFFRAETFRVVGDSEINVELKRPFAQINVGVSQDDWDAAVASGIEIAQSKVTINNVATSINLLTGSVDGETAVDFGFNTIPAKFTPEEILEVDIDGNGTIDNSEKYKYLSMSYILVDDANGGASKATLEDGLQFTFKPVSGNNIIFDKGLNTVPVQRNWRTNILGKLLTGNIDFNISINPIYDNDYNYPEFEVITDGVKYDASTKTYYIYSVAGLEWLSDETNVKKETFSGYNVKVTSDIDLEGINWTPISNFQGTFDGGNYTISNLTVTGQDDFAGLFANVKGKIKNVKMSNPNVSGHHYTGAIAAYIYGSIENCHVDGGVIKSTVKNNDNGDKVGGIVGYVGEGSYSIKENSVKNLKVVAYRDVAGIAGCVHYGVSVTNNTVDNVSIIADMLQDGGKTVADANADKVVGRNIAGADLSTNTTNNVTVTICSVDAAGIASAANEEGLIAALNKSEVTEIQLVEDMSIAVTTQSNGYGATGINVNGKTFDGNNNTFGAPGANSTWSSAIGTTGGTIKNVTINAGFRGIFVRGGSKVYIDNVVIDGPVYTISCDSANGSGLEATNSTFNGWTSYAGTIGNVIFTNCNFGEGAGYSFCRPYAPTEFVNCNFEAGYQIDARATITFENCTLDGVAITDANLASLVTYNIANASVK